MSVSILTAIFIKTCLKNKSTSYITSSQERIIGTWLTLSLQTTITRENMYRKKIFLDIRKWRTVSPERWKQWRWAQRSPQHCLEPVWSHWAGNRSPRKAWCILAVFRVESLSKIPHNEELKRWADICHLEEMDNIPCKENQRVVRTQCLGLRRYIPILVSSAGRKTKCCLEISIFKYLNSQFHNTISLYGPFFGMPSYRDCLWLRNLLA